MTRNQESRTLETPFSPNQIPINELRITGSSLVTNRTARVQDLKGKNR